MMGYPKDVKRHEADKYHAVWSALDNLINAWERLPGGQRHSPEDVEAWLRDAMSPAINRARETMGRKAPNEHEN